MQKMLKLKNIQVMYDFFWKTELSLTVQNKQETHEQPLQKKNSSEPNTVLRNKGSQTVFVFLWTVRIVLNKT